MDELPAPTPADDASVAAADSCWSFNEVRSAAPPEPFGAERRMQEFNLVVAKFHQKVASIVQAIDEDIASRGFGSAGTHARVREIFALLKYVAEAMLKFDSQAAEHELAWAKVRGLRFVRNPFSDVQSVLTRIGGEAGRLPQLVLSKSRMLKPPSEQYWAPQVRHARDEAKRFVEREYEVGSARFKLALEELAMPVKAGSAEQPGTPQVASATVVKRPSRKKASRKKPGRKKPGRKRAAYGTIRSEERHAKAWLRYKANGGYKAQFARDHKMSPKEFEKLLNRVRARNHRADK